MIIECERDNVGEILQVFPSRKGGRSVKQTSKLGQHKVETRRRASIDDRERRATTREGQYEAEYLYGEKQKTRRCLRHTRSMREIYIYIKYKDNKRTIKKKPCRRSRSKNESVRLNGHRNEDSTRRKRDSE